MSQQVIDFEMIEINGEMYPNWGDGSDPEYPYEIYEAEDMHFEYASVATNHPGYTGTGFVDGYYYNENAFVEFSFINYKTEEYTFGIVGSGEYPCVFIVNGNVIDTIEFTGANDWDKWYLASTSLFLPDVNNTIRIKALTNKGLPNIDKVIIKREKMPSIKVFLGSSNYSEVPTFKVVDSINNETKYVFYINSSDEKSFFIHTTESYFHNDNSFDMLLNGNSFLDSLIIEKSNYFPGDIFSGYITLKEGLNKFEIFPEESMLREFSIFGDNISPKILSSNAKITDEYTQKFGLIFDKPKEEYSEEEAIPPYQIVEPYRVDTDAETSQIVHEGYDNGGYYDISYGKGVGIYTRFYKEPSTANDEVSIRYALGDSDRDFFPSTGSWKNWDSISYDKEFQQGINDFSILSQNYKGLPNIDHIKITSSSPIFPIDNYLYIDISDFNTSVYSLSDSISFYTDKEQHLIKVEYSNLSSQDAKISCGHRLSKTAKAKQFRSMLLFTSNPQYMSGFHSIKATCDNDSVIIHSISIIGSNLCKYDSVKKWGITPDDEFICMKNFDTVDKVFTHSGETDELVAIFNNNGTSLKHIFIDIEFVNYDTERNISMTMNSEDIYSLDYRADEECFGKTCTIGGYFSIKEGLNVFEIESKNIDILSLFIVGDKIVPLAFDCYRNTTRYIGRYNNNKYNDYELLVCRNDDGENIMNIYDTVGYFNFKEEIGSGLEFTVFTEEETDFTFQICYKGSSKLAHLLVNEEEKIPYIEFPATNSWDTVTLNLEFDKGVQQIRLESITADGLVDIKFIKIIPNKTFYSLDCNFPKDSMNIVTNRGEYVNFIANHTDQFLYPTAYNIVYSNFTDTEKKIEYRTSGEGGSPDLYPNCYKCIEQNYSYADLVVGKNRFEIIAKDDSVKIHEISVLNQYITDVYSYSLKNGAIPEQTSNLSTDSGSTGQISSYYNKQHRNVCVTIESPLEQSGIIEITSADGRILKTKNITTKEGKNYFTVNLPNISTGIYVVKVCNGTAVKSDLLIIE